MQSSTSMLKVTCNDRQCQAEMFVPTAETIVTCSRCGQQHEIRNLKNVEEITESNITHALARYLQFKVSEVRLPRRGTEMVKVLGLSNYHCKLLSPFLTKYGMDKNTGQPKLLREMNLGEVFNCNSFCDRAFRIEPEHVPIAGFGRDITGSLDYLSETLKLIKASNGGEERLLPIYTDGDGHCLVHSVSRALLGRELFWHPLRCSLKMYFETNLDKFKELFKDFIDTDEWQSIIDECDPDFKPPDGELHGLRNIHIFGLANVLRRPIILLDSLECMQKCGDYSALFLPGFVHPDDCRGRENALNKPICIAWSSYSHNHYIPLVGVQRMPLPVLPRSLIPKVWGMPQSEIMTYMEFDETDNCIIGGDRILTENYIQRLVIAMENQFYQRYGVHPALVTDTKLFMCSDNVLLNTSVSTVIHKARIIVSEGRMFRCLNCKALVELHFDASAFSRGGNVYTHLVNIKKKLIPGVVYYVTTPQCYISCSYDAQKDSLVPDKTSFKMRECSYCCTNLLEQLRPDGHVAKQPIIRQEKVSVTQSESSSDKKDSTEPSTMLRVKFQYEGTDIEDVIPDFKLIREDALDDAVSQFSLSFLRKHFPDKIGDADLHKLIMEKIFETIGKTPVTKTDASPTVDAAPEKPMEANPTDSVVSNGETSIEMDSVSAAPAPKIIKVVSQSGLQVNLDLTAVDISYSELQNWVKTNFCIDVSHQKIKIGFPPKELEAPTNDKTEVLCLNHGDRLMVENCPQQEKRFSNTPYIRNSGRDFSPINKVSGYQNEVIWRIAKSAPECFKKGGSYYEEVNRQHILTDMIHVRIDAFPTKAFSYNVFNDSLELCVKPLGHFEIGPDLDSQIEQVQEGETVPGYRKCPIMSLKISNRDPVISKTVKKSLSAASTSTTQTSAETLTAPLLRKGPGFSILTSPESDDMDIS